MELDTMVLMLSDDVVAEIGALKIPDRIGLSFDSGTFGRRGVALDYLSVVSLIEALQVAADYLQPRDAATRPEGGDA